MVAHRWETVDYPGEFEVEKDAEGKPIGPMSKEAERKRLLQMAKAARQPGPPIEQENPKTRGKTFEPQERHKAASSFIEAADLGVSFLI